MPGPRLESILGHCKRHALLHMAPKWFDHWTTWAGTAEGNTALPEIGASTAPVIDTIHVSC